MIYPAHLTEIVELTRLHGILRPRDLDAHGIARQYLRIAEQRGLVVRTGRGLYSMADVEIAESHSIAEVAKRVPRGVVCLISALSFHNVGTQIPRAVWIAIGEKDRRPLLDYPPIKTVRFSISALNFGREIHNIEGVPAQVFSLAKTIADCFKYRNKLGLDVALEALREALRSRKATPAAIWEAAKICRVANVIRPYMEALV